MVAKDDSHSVAYTADGTLIGEWLEQELVFRKPLALDEEQVDD